MSARDKGPMRAVVTFVEASGSRTTQRARMECGHEVAVARGATRYYCFQCRGAVASTVVVERPAQPRLRGSVCASCGLALRDGTGLCPHHQAVYGEDWALGNRVWCDFFHRGVVPKRLDAADRWDDLVEA